jgi:hypothetical protein
VDFQFAYMMAAQLLLLSFWQRSHQPPNIQMLFLIIMNVNELDEDNNPNANTSQPNQQLLPSPIINSYSRRWFCSACLLPIPECSSNIDFTGDGYC